MAEIPGAGAGGDGEAPGAGLGFDSIYVSPHEDDALFSCIGRLLSDRAEGLRSVVVLVFSSPQTESAEVLEALEKAGARYVSLGLAAAAERREAYRLHRAAVSATIDEDDMELVREIAERLNEVVVRTGAREIHVPLGAGGHIDHRLCYEAGLLTFRAGAGRNVFFYEERPDVLVPSTTRIRLAELGARLPPAATRIHDDVGVARAAWGCFAAPHVRSQAGGLLERLRCARAQAWGWRESQQWHPLKAYGPRLQPVVRPLASPGLDEALAVLALCTTRLTTLFGSTDGLRKRARMHARRLGAGDYAERYWLLLPPRDAGGLAEVPAELLS